MSTGTFEYVTDANGDSPRIYAKFYAIGDAFYVEGFLEYSGEIWRIAPGFGSGTDPGTDLGDLTGGGDLSTAIDVNDPTVYWLPGYFYVWTSGDGAWYASTDGNEWTDISSLGYGGYYTDAYGNVWGMSEHTLASHWHTSAGSWFVYDPSVTSAAKYIDDDDELLYG